MSQPEYFVFLKFLQLKNISLFITFEVRLSGAFRTQEEWSQILCQSRTWMSYPFLTEPLFLSGVSWAIHTLFWKSFGLVVFQFVIRMSQWALFASFKVFFSIKFQTLLHSFHKTVPNASELHGQVYHSSDPVLCNSFLYLLLFLLWNTRQQDKNKLRIKGFILAHNLRKKMWWKKGVFVWQQGHQASGIWSHFVHGMKKKGKRKERGVCQCSVCFFSFSLRNQPIGWYHWYSR